MLGVKETAWLMEQLGLTLPPWVQTMLKQGNTSFYRSQDGRELVYNPTSGSYEPVRTDPERISLEALRKAGKEIARNDSASLLDMGDGVLCFEIHSHANAIDPYVVEMGMRALRELDWAGDRQRGPQLLCGGQPPHGWHGSPAGKVRAAA